MAEARIETAKESSAQETSTAGAVGGGAWADDHPDGHTPTDPEQVVDLVDDPAHAERLAELRRGMDEWQDVTGDSVYTVRTKHTVSDIGFPLFPNCLWFCWRVPQTL